MARFKNISEPRFEARTDLGPSDAVKLMCTNIFILDFTVGEFWGCTLWEEDEGGGVISFLKSDDLKSNLKLFYFMNPTF